MTLLATKFNAELHGIVISQFGNGTMIQKCSFIRWMLIGYVSVMHRMIFCTSCNLYKFWTCAICNLYNLSILSVKPYILMTLYFLIHQTNINDLHKCQFVVIYTTR